MASWIVRVVLNDFAVLRKQGIDQFGCRHLVIVHLGPRVNRQPILFRPYNPPKYLNHGHLSLRYVIPTNAKIPVLLKDAYLLYTT